MPDLKEPEERTAKDIIEDDGWADCWVCRDIFKRRTPTKRYCNICKEGFCEGIHGTFEGKRMGICVKCYNRKTT